MIAQTYDPTRGRWIPWVFVGAMGLVIVVNATLIFFALTTFTGVSTPRAYDRGRTYNDVLQEAARQDALGWRAQVTLARDTLTITATNATGAAVPGRLEGILRRPLSGEEIALTFRASAPGIWSASVAPSPGQWEARLTLHGASGRFDIRERIIAP